MLRTLLPHRAPGPRTLAVGLALAGLGAGSAAAGTSATTVINFAGAHVINEGTQTGDFRIWGLGAARVIVGSQGSNVIVADGSCPPGSTDTAYCSDAPEPRSKNRFIYANGSGTNVVYAGYGPSTIVAGPGTNTIYALSPKGDRVYCHGPQDVVYAYPNAKLFGCSQVVYEPAPAERGLTRSERLRRHHRART